MYLAPLIILIDHFETIHTCDKHIEEVHVGFDGARINLTELRPLKLSQFLRLFFLHCRLCGLCNLTIFNRSL